MSSYQSILDQGLLLNPHRGLLLDSLGFKRSHKFAPDETGYWIGVPLRRDWLNPFVTMDVRLLPRTAGKFHRLQVLCTCGQWVNAGRLYQHSKGHKNASNR